MSTYLYVTCLDHDPPLIAEEESGQHTYDLPEIRRDIADRTYLVDVYMNSINLDLGYWRNHTVKFLAQHQKCRIGIQDEYGRDYPLSDEEPK